MMNRIRKLLEKSYPQNFIVRKPVYGTLLFAFVLFVFLVLYKPLNVRGSQNFGLVFSMLLYQLMSSVPVMALAFLINRTSCFSKVKKWTFAKELKSVAIILIGAGISIYFLGFVMEEPANRWNWPTFFDAVYRVVLIGLVPIGFFTLSNIRHLYVTEVIQEFSADNPLSGSQQNEAQIQIVSQLKKEELKFFPSQFVYAESDGNYVVFHLKEPEKYRKVVIRNSISNIEQQLSAIPFILRTHRAFLVNVKKVASKKGNSLGYRLKFSGAEEEVPVSRQNTQAFDELIRQYR